MIDGTPVQSDNKIRNGTRIHGSGFITKTFPVLSEFKYKNMCSGCRNDFYNLPGNGMNGECWSFKKATVVNKVGHSTLHVMNGPDMKMIKTLSCWHAVSK